MNVQQLQRRADKASTYQPVCMKHFKVQKERCQAPRHVFSEFINARQYAAESTLIVEQENEM